MKPNHIRVHNPSLAPGDDGEWFMSRLIDGKYHRIGYVTGATRNHEKVEALPSFGAATIRTSWRRIVRNRIAFRHDDKRGPISATLIHAVY